MTCAACGFENPDGMRFCGQCGAALRHPSVAERRQLTVLFCDLVESTTLAERLDPEELRDVVRDYQAVSGAAVERFGGHVAQYLGDGLLVYFGYPHAHEEDTRRAVHAALGIVAAVRDLNRRLQAERGIQLRVRVGMHTGPVVAGEVGAGQTRERLALGQTPNVAARLQGVAEPDTVVVSGAVHRLVEGFFACEPLGSHALRGLSQPVEVYRVLGESAAQSRFEIAVSRGLSPPVGRLQEIGALDERLADVRAGRGQVVLITGGAGIGKSRLVHMFRERTGDDGIAWLVARCSAYHQGSALHPISELVRQLLGIDLSDSSTDRIAKLERWLEPFGFPLVDVVPLFAGLLSVPLRDPYRPAELAPQREKDRLREYLVTLLLRLSQREPVVFVVEDLHWVDPSTVELLDGLVPRVAPARVLVLLTYRSAYRCPWSANGHVAELTLERMGRAEVEQMARGVAGGKLLPSEVMQQVVDKTDGVPLFVEELTKMVLETGLLREADDRYELAGPLPGLAIPATLHDSLMARLDRLGAAKQVAQVSAVLGREFSYDILRRVIEQTEESLRQALDELVDAQLLFQRGELPAATFSFKHALIQDAAYESLLKRARQGYHARIADTLATEFPERAALQPEIVAQHYTQAGRSEPAVAYWLQAGQRAIEQSANREAIDHLNRGLALVETLPDSAERHQLELAYQMTLGGAWTASRGYAAPEVQQAFTQALALCEKMGETPQLFWVVFGLWTFYVVRADFRQALELGLRLLRLAEAQDDAGLTLQAHFAVGLSRLQLGELVAARQHFERGVALDVPGRRRTRPGVEVADAGVTTRSFLAFVLWMMGTGDQAIRYNDDALALADELTHPFSTAYALVLTAWIRRFRRETDEVLRAADAGRRLSEEKGFLYLQLLSSFLFASAVADSPSEPGAASAELVRPLEETFAALMGIGARFGETLMCAVIAERCLRHNLPTSAERYLDRGIASADETGERYWVPELRRLRGELAVRRGEREVAVAECRAALRLAEEQGSQAFALRAATSLKRWLAADRGSDDGRTLLEDVLGRFTEGFETADLQEARELLDRRT